MRLPVIAAALLAAVPAAAPAAEQRDSKPSLRATTPTCRSGATPDERFAVFTGSMPARRGTARMAMRFELQIREPGDERYTKVQAPKFGRWERSKPGRTGFIYSKRVDGLTAPARYRAVVRFRWYDADGRTQRTLKRTSPSCRQPDQRPNLRLLALRATPGPIAWTTTYLLTVVNSGRGSAAAFEVTAGPDDGGSQASVTVGGMAAREARVLEITGRPCVPGTKVRIRLDSGADVDESSETDNDVRRDCP